MTKIVTLDVRPPEAAAQDVVNACKSGKARRSARISFTTPALLWKVSTAKRWEILEGLWGAGPATVREVARRVGRDLESVHTGLMARQRAGVLDKADEGRVVIPCESVQVEFLRQAA